MQKVGFLLFALAVIAFGAQESLSGAGSLFTWLPYVVLAFVIFGASGLSMKLATRDTMAPAALAGWCTGFAFVTCGSWAIASPTLPAGLSFWSLSFSYGLLLGLGLWTSFEAYRLGQAAVVTAITALYPAVTAGLSISLPSIGESLSPLKLLSIALSLIAGAALAIEPVVEVDPSTPLVL